MRSTCRADRARCDDGGSDELPPFVCTGVELPLPRVAADAERLEVGGVEPRAVREGHDVIDDGGRHPRPALDAEAVLGMERAVLALPAPRELREELPRDARPVAVVAARRGRRPAIDALMERAVATTNDETTTVGMRAGPTDARPSRRHRHRRAGDAE